MSPYAGLERRVLSALDAAPPRIPVVLGPCGTGRTTLLLALADTLGRESAQYVDVERAASTPERFALALRSTCTLPCGPADAPPDESAHAAFDRVAEHFRTARGRGGPATFLLDEVLELRTFENFPGLREVLRDLVRALADSTNRFVLTSRYATRARRLLRDAPGLFEVMHLPALSTDEVAAMLPFVSGDSRERQQFLARTIELLADGRAAYVRAIGEATAAMGSRGEDPVSALTALLMSDGGLTEWCGYRYELRLHRARGYGALKAILEILAADQPLTLTEVALRLHRTPGSTKDYLSWLEDVDLIVARDKRYRFADPVLRLWVRLHCRAVPPTVDDVAREVQAYALARLPTHEPETVPASAPVDRRPSGIIEID